MLPTSRYADFIIGLDFLVNDGLQVTPEARKFVNKGERLVMKFRGALAKGAAKSASGTTKRRKRASMAGAGDEPPSAAGPSRKGSKRDAPPQEDVMDLYQDDDVFDFGSPKKPAIRAQTRASASVDVDDEIEDADDDHEGPYKLLNNLKDVRARVSDTPCLAAIVVVLMSAQIAEERNIVDPAHIITDDDLFMIATIQPSGTLCYIDLIYGEIIDVPI